MGFLLHAVIPSKAALQRAKPVISLISLGDGGDGVGAHPNTDNVPPGQLLPLLAIKANPCGAPCIPRNLEVQLSIVWQDDWPAEPQMPMPNCNVLMGRVHASELCSVEEWGHSVGMPACGHVLFT